MRFTSCVKISPTQEFWGRATRKSEGIVFTGVNYYILGVIKDSKAVEALKTGRRAVVKVEGDFAQEMEIKNGGLPVGKGIQFDWPSFFALPKSLEVVKNESGYFFGVAHDSQVITIGVVDYCPPIVLRQRWHRVALQILRNPTDWIFFSVRDRGGGWIEIATDEQVAVFPAQVRGVLENLILENYGGGK